jgi:hypothetical protein
MAKSKRKPAQKRTTRRARKTWDKAFLAELRLTGVVAAACEIAQVARRTVYDRREADPAFKAAWDQALEESADWLEKEARRRAEEGNLKSVYYKGELVGFDREYSDTLMALLLKANRPDKFGDKLTLRLAPEQVSKLEKYGLTPMQAIAQIINAMDEDDASTR